MNKDFVDSLVEKSKVLYNDETVGLEYLVFDRYRFVELVVRECLDIAEQSHDTPNGQMRCNNDRETVRLIKERFGVV